MGQWPQKCKAFQSTNQHGRRGYGNINKTNKNIIKISTGIDLDLADTQY